MVLPYLMPVVVEANKFVQASARRRFRVQQIEQLALHVVCVAFMDIDKWPQHVGVPDT